MQNSGGRGRRHGRQPITRSATAAAENNASSMTDDAKPLTHYTPGATLNAASLNRASPPETRSRSRMMTRSTRAMEENERARSQQATLQVVRNYVTALQLENDLTKEDGERILDGAKNIHLDDVQQYLKDALGPENATKAQNFIIHQQRLQVSAGRSQQGAIGGMDGILRGAYPMTDARMVAPYQVGRPPMPVRPLKYKPGGSMGRRPEHAAYPGEAVGMAVNRVNMPGQPTVPTVRDRQPPVAVNNAGEVAKTLMPQRIDQVTPYATSGNPIAAAGQRPSSSEFTAPVQNAQVDRRNLTDATCNKRPAPEAAKSTRYNKARRGAEDPNAPDAGDIDVLEEAQIQLEAEQQAMMSTVLTQSNETDGQLIKSRILDVHNVSLRLQQVLREQGLQLSGSDAVDVVIQGMEEKFEAFLKKALKRALHRSETGFVTASTDTRIVTSDIRCKLREIKKKQEQYKANKLREEREKLEQLAETASKKELARDKELAAKVERVKRQKQFCAEREATSRALSNALGGMTFEKFHRLQKEKQAAKVSIPPVPVQSIHPPAPPPPPISRPIPIAPPQPRPPPAIDPPPAPTPIETIRRAVVSKGDILDVMSHDPDYAFSRLLFEFYLS